jgi:hypothetical protein
MAELNRRVDTFGPDDHVLPEIKLIQGTTTGKAIEKNGKPGQFFNTVSEEIYPDGFDFVFVDCRKTRTFWGREVIGDEPPSCSSMDADSYVSNDEKDCHKCPNRLDHPWSVSASERRKKCTIGYNVMGILVNDWTPFIMRITGISSQEFMKLLTRYAYNKGLRNEENNAKIDYHKVKVAVSSKQQQTTSGVTYALRFGEFTPFEDKNTEEYLLSFTATILGQGDLLPEGTTEGEPPATETQETKTTEQKQETKSPEVRVINQEKKPVSPVQQEKKNTPAAPPAAAPKVTKPVQATIPGTTVRTVDVSEI